MALKKETLDKIAKAVKLDPAAFEAALKDEKEVDLKVEDGLENYTPDELTQLKKNEYDRGKEVGVEMAVKDAKDKLGLSFQGKTIEGLATAVKTKALEEAKIEPDKRVSELEGKLATVQQTAQELQTKLTETERRANEATLQGQLLKHVPAGTLVEPDEVLTLMKGKGYSFESTETGLVVKLNGKPVQDKLANPKPANEVITEFTKERKLVAESAQTPAGRGGAGGAGGSGGKYTKMSEIKADFEKEGKSTLGAEFNQAVMKARADFKEFDMNG